MSLCIAILVLLSFICADPIYQDIYPMAEARNVLVYDSSSALYYLNGTCGALGNDLSSPSSESNSTGSDSNRVAPVSLRTYITSSQAYRTPTSELVNRPVSNTIRDRMAQYLILRPQIIADIISDREDCEYNSDGKVTIRMPESDGSGIENQLYGIVINDYVNEGSYELYYDPSYMQEIEPVSSNDDLTKYIIYYTNPLGNKNLYLKLNSGNNRKSTPVVSVSIVKIDMDTDGLSNEYTLPTKSALPGSNLSVDFGDIDIVNRFNISDVVDSLDTFLDNVTNGLVRVTSNIETSSSDISCESDRIYSYNCEVSSSASGEYELISTISLESDFPILPVRVGSSIDFQTEISLFDLISRIVVQSTLPNDNNPAIFTQSELSLTAQSGSSVSVNLLDYITDLDGSLSSYNLSIPSSEYCQINSNTLNCTFPAGLSSNIVVPVTLTNLAHTSNSVLNIAISVRPVVSDLNPTKFSEESLELDVNENSSHSFDLSSYIEDADGFLSSDLTYSISSNSAYVVSSMSGSTLNLEVPLTELDRDALEVTLRDNSHSYESRLVIDLEIDQLPQRVSLTSPSLTIRVPYLSNLELDLSNNIINPDLRESSTYELSENSDRCSITNTMLTCEGVDSLYSVEVSLKDLLYDETSTLTISYEPDSYVQIGSLSSLSRTFVEGEALSYNVDISSVITGVTSLDSVSLESVSGSIVPNYTYESGILHIEFNDLAHSDKSKYKLRVNADGVSILSTDTFSLTYIEMSDLSFRYSSPSSIARLINAPTGSEFDLGFSLSSDLDYDLSSLELDYNIYNSVEGVSITPLSSTGLSKELRFSSDYALKDTLEGPRVISIVPVVNGVEYSNEGSDSIEVNLVPLKREFMTNYITSRFTTYYNESTGTYASRPDGRNDYVPMGVKLEIPYEITNSFDVPFTAYVCEVVESAEFRNTYLYNDSYVKDDDASICSSRTFEVGTTRDKLYASAPMLPEDSSVRVSPLIVINSNNYDVSGENYFDYLGTNDQYLLSYSESSFLSEWESSIPVQGFTGGSLTINGKSSTPYNLFMNTQNIPVVIGHVNNYQYKVVDLNSCATVGYRETTTFQYSLSNSYLGISGNPCVYIAGIIPGDVVSRNYSIDTYGSSITQSDSSRISIATNFEISGSRIPSSMGARLYIN